MKTINVLYKLPSVIEDSLAERDIKFMIEDFLEKYYMKIIIEDPSLIMHFSFKILQLQPSWNRMMWKVDIFDLVIS